MVRKSCVPNLVKIGPQITPESRPQVPERLSPVHTCVWIESTHAGHRISDIRHRTRKWFYILSNAAIHSIGQTKSFSQSSSLQTHKRRHEGVKPYVCYECSKSFYTAGELRRHAVKHSDVKLFCCCLCAKDFKDKHYFPKHFKRCAVKLGFSNV